MAFHKTVPVQVTVDVDESIASAVQHLNSIPGIRTYASCQGTVGEGGAEPYRAFVLTYWPDNATALIERRFTVGERLNGSAYLHPKTGCDWPIYAEFDVEECEGCGDLSDDLREDAGMVKLCPACAVLK